VVNFAEMLVLTNTSVCLMLFIQTMKKLKHSIRVNNQVDGHVISVDIVKVNPLPTKDLYNNFISDREKNKIIMFHSIGLFLIVIQCSYKSVLL